MINFNAEHAEIAEKHIPFILVLGALCDLGGRLAIAILETKC